MLAAGFTVDNDVAVAFVLVFCFGVCVALIFVSDYPYWYGPLSTNMCDKSTFSFLLTTTVYVRNDSFHAGQDTDETIELFSRQQLFSSNGPFA